MGTQAWTGTYEELPVGAFETSSQLIDGDAIDKFADAIQSFNPIHMDGQWARENTPYPDRIAHGVMTTALMSKPLVQFCEHYKIRTALLSSSSKYIRAVVAGAVMYLYCLLLVFDEIYRTLLTGGGVLTRGEGYLLL